MSERDNLNKLLKVEDVARMLSIRPITVYSWAEQGKLRSLKISRLLRFRESDIHDFIKSAERENNGTGY